MGSGVVDWKRDEMKMMMMMMVSVSVSVNWWC